MALPSIHRLRHRQDFAAVYRWGRSCHSPHLHLRALPPRSQGSQNFLPPRIGVVVSQKVSKRAVVRNRIRRQIQAILHPFLADLPQGWRFVIGVKSTGISCHSDQFLQELKQLFLDAEVFNGHS